MSPLRAEDSLRWRLSSTRRLVDRTRRVIAEVLTEGRWAVRYSGGKDSLVLVALARSLDPQVLVSWSDEEAETPETLAALRAAQARWPGNWLVTAAPRDHCAGETCFRCWDERGGWLREPLPEARYLPEGSTAWLRTRGYRSLVGTRRDENAMRRYNRTHNRWTVKPLLGWTDADIWAAVAGLDLPVNAMYARLVAAGWPRERCKTLPLVYALDGSYGPYERLWPDLIAGVRGRCR